MTEGEQQSENEPIRETMIKPWRLVSQQKMLWLDVTMSNNAFSCEGIRDSEGETAGNNRRQILR
jgi:hypothetical protein